MHEDRFLVRQTDPKTGRVAVFVTPLLMALVLVFALSLRLRQREIDTIFKLGCSRLTIAQLLGAEIVIIAAFSAVLCLLILGVVSHYAQQLVRTLFI